MHSFGLMGLTALLLFSAQQADAAFPEDFSSQAVRRSMRETKNAIESQSIDRLQQRLEDISDDQREEEEEQLERREMEEVQTLAPLPTITTETVLTRAVFVAVLVRELYSAAEIENCYWDIASSVPPRFTLVFTDVHVDDTFAKEICIALRDGIVEGYRDGSFHPNATINLAEGSKILSRAYALAPYAELEKNTLWFGPYLYALAVRNIVPENIRTVNQMLTVGDLREMVSRIDGDITWEPARSYGDLTDALLPRRVVAPAGQGGVSGSVSSRPRVQSRSSSSSSFPRSRIPSSSEAGDWWNPFD